MRGRQLSLTRTEQIKHKAENRKKKLSKIKCATNEA